MSLASEDPSVSRCIPKVPLRCCCSAGGHLSWFHCCLQEHKEWQRGLEMKKEEVLEDMVKDAVAGGRLAEEDEGETDGDYDEEESDEPLA